MSVDQKHRGLQQLLADNREEILDIVRSRNGREVHVFGSAARGDDGPDSDIDLAVTLGPDGRYFDLIAIQAELCDLLGRDVDVLCLDGIRKNYERQPTIRRANILRDLTPL